MFKNKNQYQIFCVIVVMAYLIFYGAFLFLTNFFPYVFDNNESFSALVQAKNLFDFGLHKSFGLTDEAVGSLSAAHPYVYTHEGNLPRFFTLLLYALGSHSMESQLFITTFTIGLLGILFCYHFFAKYVSNLFACIFCLVLMTDYVMFAQWHVNLFRVWHLFFFFSSFLCAHGLQSHRRKLFIFLSILNFACLLYMELAYAAFVSVSVFVYIFFQKTELKTKILDCIIMGIGLMIGCSIIVLQNIAFLGWENFILDLSYTFKARNQLFSSEEALKQILKFCADNKIAFWVNMNTIEGIRNPNLFLHFFYRYCLLPYTPFLTVSACIVALSSMLFCLSECLDRQKLFLSNFFRSGNLLFTLAASFLFLASVLALTYISYPILLGKMAYLGELKKIGSLSSLFLCALFFYFYGCASSKQICASQNGLALIFLAGSFLLSCVFYRLEIYTGHFTHLLNTTVTHALSCTFLYPAIFGVLLLIINPGYESNHSFLQRQNQIFKKLIPFVIATVIGCFSAYLLFPGYIRTAYMMRYCTFSVYAHIVLYAWLFYVLVSYLTHNFSSSLNSFKSIACLFLLAIFGYCWIYVQASYIQEFPANHYQQLINTLKKEGYHHKPFISNNYAAPYAYSGDTWGYLDPIFGYSKLNKSGTDFHLKHDMTYMWFADAATNKGYSKPKFYICWLNYSFDELGNNGAKCGKVFSLIGGLRHHKGKDSGLVELARDPSDHDKWSIVKLPSTH